MLTSTLGVRVTAGVSRAISSPCDLLTLTLF